MKVKIFSIFVVFGLLLLALAQISGVVHDRASHRQVAVQSVARSLAGAQTLLGPLAQVTCTEEWDLVLEKRTETERREFTLVSAPTALSLQGASQLEPRARGLLATQVFTLKGLVTAQWADLTGLRPTRQHAGSRMTCGPVAMMMSVSDARGLRTATLQVAEQPLPLKPGTLNRSYPRGVHATLPTTLDLNAPLTARLDMELMGTEQVFVAPIGDATEVKLTSSWPHPSFGGQFLPSERTVTDKGFEANWRVSALASTAQSEALKSTPICGVPHPESGASPACVETLGVRFVDPTDTYALSDRATKYGLLFVGLTFLAMGLFEFMKALRVHPIQYFLVGAAICIFFLLLVSLSEHLPFAAAYALAAAACVLLLTYYASHMLASWRLGGPLGLGIAAMYGLLFLLLQLEQTALVVGATALFLVLAATMTLTRRVDWYARLQELTVTRVPAAKSANSQPHSAPTH